MHACFCSIKSARDIRETLRARTIVSIKHTQMQTLFNIKYIAEVLTTNTPYKEWMINMLIIDGAKYKLWTPKDEEREFHPMIKAHSKEIFGTDSLYFDVRHKLISRSGIGSIPDAYAISLSKPYQWYVIENELASHPVYDHIVKQLTKFISGIKNQSARNKILDTFYDEIKNDKILRAYVGKAIGSQEIHHFLSKLLSNPPRILVFIDQKTEEVVEACQVLKYQTSIVEFKTFVREDAENVHAHIFEPVYTSTARDIITDARIEGIERRKISLHLKNWQTLLAWVDANTRNLMETLGRLIEKRFDNVFHKASGKYYIFYKGKPGTKSAFAAFLLTKKFLKVRIRTDPATFKDPKKQLKETLYSGWFFKTGQEREFKVTNELELDYAAELIKQSYDLAVMRAR